MLTGLEPATSYALCQLSYNICFGVWGCGTPQPLDGPYPAYTNVATSGVPCPSVDLNHLAPATVVLYLQGASARGLCRTEVRT